jgi:hypothetical protein
MLGMREYRFRITAALDMSSSGAGLVNATISNSSLSSNSAFLSLGAIFSEYFVHGFRVRWQPISMFNYPLTGVTATSVANLPLGCADIQHLEPAYANIGFATGNWRYAHHSTGLPFTKTWINSENPRSGVVTADSATSPTQSWALCTNANVYTGFLQFISPTGTALPVSQKLGTFLVEWDITFRVRSA